VAAAAYDIQLEQGETWQPVWTWSWPTPTPGVPGAPFNFTGYSAHMQIRSTYYAGATLLDLHSNTGGIVLGGAAGTMQPKMNAAQSAALTSGPIPLSRMMNGRRVALLGSYDVKITDPSGNVSTLMGGDVWIAPQNTVGGA
jgi:hypothetical protein